MFIIPSREISTIFHRRNTKACLFNFPAENVHDISIKYVVSDLESFLINKAISQLDERRHVVLLNIARNF